MNSWLGHEFIYKLKKEKKNYELRGTKDREDKNGAPSGSHVMNSYKNHISFLDMKSYAVNSLWIHICICILIIHMRICILIHNIQIHT